VLPGLRPLKSSGARKNLPTCTLPDGRRAASERALGLTSNEVIVTRPLAIAQQEVRAPARARHEAQALAKAAASIRCCSDHDM